MFPDPRFIDEQVRRGDAPSTAAVVAAVEKARRREIAARDAAILARAASGDDLDDLAAFVSRTHLDDLA